MSEEHVMAMRRLEAMRDWFAPETEERAAIKVVLRFIDDLLYVVSHAKCGYCGEVAERGKTDEEESARWQAHAAACPKHPMREVERERDDLRERLQELRERGDD